MARTIDWQPATWITLPVGTMNTYLQHCQDWLETDGYRTMELEAFIFHNDADMELELYGSNYLDTGWELLYTYSAAGSVSPTVTYFSADYPLGLEANLRRYYRFKINGETASAPYEMCFRLRATLHA